MTRGSVKEYVEAIRERYQRAGRKEKKRILDQFTEVTGYHRKAAIRLLGRDGSRPQGRRRGRPLVMASVENASLRTSQWLVRPPEGHRGGAATRLGLLCLDRPRNRGYRTS